MFKNFKLRKKSVLFVRINLFYIISYFTAKYDPSIEKSYLLFLLFISNHVRYSRQWQKHIHQNETDEDFVVPFAQILHLFQIFRVIGLIHSDWKSYRYANDEDYSANCADYLIDILHHYGNSKDYLPQIIPHHFSFLDYFW